MRVVKPRIIPRSFLVSAKPWVVWLLLLLTPRRPYVVIHGYPDSEGNSVEMVRATAARYSGRIYLLAADTAVAAEILRTACIDESGRVTVLRYRSLTAVWRFVTAEVSMFTHGVYGRPKRAPRKTSVNLWHGGGIKAGIMTDKKGRPHIHSDYLVASTRWKGEIFARQCRLPAGGLLLTGNPRIDQLRRGNPAHLSELGLDPLRPFVLWMPTFRRSTRQPATWAGAGVDYETQAVNSLAAAVVQELAAAGIQTVIKPHPSDAEKHDVEGAITVTNETLTGIGMFPYHLIGLSSGLLTDYSSVWIDYLTLDRPIGFIVPDEDAYADQRGFDPPDALDWLPGPRIRTFDEIAPFALDVANGGTMTAARRAEVIEHLGLAADVPVADSILDALASDGVFGTRLRPLKAGHPAVAVP